MRMQTRNAERFECELGLCDGSGIVLKANGPDDFDEDFCLCEEGQRLQTTMEERIAAVPDPRFMCINGQIRELV
jgi:hypothetical protein